MQKLTEKPLLGKLLLTAYALPEQYRALQVVHVQHLSYGSEQKQLNKFEAQQSICTKQGLSVLSVSQPASLSVNTGIKWCLS